MDSPEALAFERWKIQPDQEGLATLLRASQELVYGISQRVLEDRHDSEDACQAVLLKLAEHVHRLVSADHYRNWLYATSLTTALNVKRNRARHRDRERRFARENTVARPAPEDPPSDRLYEQMARLGDEERGLLIDHYFRREPLRRIARSRGCSAVAIWKRLRRARRALAQALSDRGRDPLLGLGPLAAGTGGIAPPEIPQADVVAHGPFRGAGTRLLDLSLSWGGTLMKWKALAALAALVILVAGTAIFRSLSGERRSISGMRPGYGGKAALSPKPLLASAKTPPEAAPSEARPEAAPGPAEPEEEGATLLARLVRFRELLLNRASGGSVPGSRLNLAWKGLGRFIMAEPDTFVTFLRAPESEAAFGGLMGLLCEQHSYGDGFESYTGIRVTKLPEALVAGLEGILETGTRTQKLALLSFLKTNDRDDRLLNASRHLLFEPDPEIQAAALHAASGNDSWILENGKLLRDVWNASPDRSVRTACLYALGESHLASVNNMFLDCALDYLRSAGTQTEGFALENLIHCTMQSNLTRENEARYADLLGLVLRCSPGDHSMEEFIHATLCLSPRRAAPLLEQSLLQVSNPSLKDRITRTLSLVRAGESRGSELGEAFKGEEDP